MSQTKKKKKAAAAAELKRSGWLASLTKVGVDSMLEAEKAKAARAKARMEASGHLTKGSGTGGGTQVWSWLLS